MEEIPVFPALSDSLSDVAEIETACRTTNVDANDYTILTYQDHKIEIDPCCPKHGEEDQTLGASGHREEYDESYEFKSCQR